LLLRTVFNSYVKQSSAYEKICLTIRCRAWMERARHFLTLELEDSGGIQLETSEEKTQTISLVVILKCFFIKKPTGVESDKLH
jgi:hypothetical protein